MTKQKIKIPDLPRLPFQDELASLRKDLKELEDKQAELYARFNEAAKAFNLDMIKELNETNLFVYQCKKAIAVIEEGQRQALTMESKKRSLKDRMEVK